MKSPVRSGPPQRAKGGSVFLLLCHHLFLFEAGGGKSLGSFGLVLHRAGEEAVTKMTA